MILYDLLSHGMCDKRHNQNGKISAIGWVTSGQIYAMDEQQVAAREF